MLVAVISDTHLPRAGRRLPEECLERMRRADLIVHAGDLVDLSVLRDLEQLGEVAAVHGNVDTAAVRAALPERRLLETGGARIGVVHDAGPSRGRLARLASWFPEADAVIFGHSHIPLHERGHRGFQIFNPGSPTDRRRQRSHTMGLVTVADGRPRFELVRLD